MILQQNLLGFIGGILFTVSMMFFSTTSSQAGWREDVQVFKIGIVSDRERSVAIRQIEPFRAALSQAIDMPVSVFVYRKFRGLINAQSNKKIQYGVYTASSFATAWAKCKCIKPVAAAKLTGGALKYHSILIVRKDRISKLSELKGKRIAISGKNSLSGYIVPKKELDGKDLRFVDLPGKPDDTVIVGAGTTSSSRKLFQGGLVDGLFGWATLDMVAADSVAGEGASAGTFFNLTNINQMDASELKIIWKSKPIFTGPHAIAVSVPKVFENKIGNFLLNLYDSQPRAYDSVENYRGGGFAEVELSDYQPLIDIIDARDKIADAAQTK